MARSSLLGFFQLTMSTELLFGDHIASSPGDENEIFRCVLDSWAERGHIVRAGRGSGGGWMGRRNSCAFGLKAFVYLFGASVQQVYII